MRIGHILFLALCLIGCTATQKQFPSKLNLDSVETLKLGTTTTQEAEILFGKASVSAPIENNLTAWVYLEGKIPTTRLSLIFNKSGKLLSVNWFLNPNESESSLSAIKKRYPNYKLNERKPEWTNSHFGPTDIYYEDKKNQFMAVFDENEGRVSAIGWEQEGIISPRKPAEYKF